MAQGIKETGDDQVVGPDVELDESEGEIDPVCGMEVERSSAAGSTLYEGSRYFFCSEDCKVSFDLNPEEYAASTPGLSP